MNEFELNKDELEVFYEILFKRILEIMKKPQSDIDPFSEMIKNLSVLSTIFSFKSMISTIPELVAYAIRYGMLVQRAYQEEQVDIEQDKQEREESEQEQKEKISKIQNDMDKVSLYL